MLNIWQCPRSRTIAVRSATSGPLPAAIKAAPVFTHVQWMQRREHQKDFYYNVLDSFPAYFTPPKDRAPETPPASGVQETVPSHLVGTTIRLTPTNTSGSQLYVHRSVVTTTTPSAFSMTFMSSWFAIWLGSWEPGQRFGILAHFATNPQKPGSWLWTLARKFWDFSSSSTKCDAMGKDYKVM